MKVEYKKRLSVINELFVEQVIYDNSSLNWVQIVVIFCGFNSMSLFANNSDDTQCFCGIKVMIWQVILLLSILLSLPYVYRLINRNKPALIINKFGLKFRGKIFLNGIISLSYI